jgi:hypothetical protein
LLPTLQMGGAIPPGSFFDLREIAICANRAASGRLLMAAELPAKSVFGNFDLVVAANPFFRVLHPVGRRVLRQAICVKGTGQNVADTQPSPRSSGTTPAVWRRWQMADV